MRLSLIIPTGNRSILLRGALQQIGLQTLRPDEVIVVDGGRRPFPLLELGLELGTSVHYRRVVPETSIGERRNIAVAMASGDLIAHWDDDDWHHPDFLRELVGWFESEKPDLGGMSRFWSYDFLLKRGWKTQLWDMTSRPYGATFIYPKRLWKAVGGFEDLQRGEDNALYQAFEKHGLRCAAKEGTPFFVYIRHTRNVSTVPEPIIHPDWTSEARAIMGEAISFYDDLAELVVEQPTSSHGTQWHLPGDLRAFRPETKR